MVKRAVRRTSPRNKSAKPGVAAGGFVPRRVPFLGLGNFAANPEDQQRGQHADQKHDARDYNPPTHNVVSEASKMPTFTPV